MRRTIASSVGLALLLATSAVAPEVSITPRVIELERLTCADLLARRGEDRDRALMYLNGYMNGLRKQKVWDEKAEGERIDRAVTECRASAAKPVLEVMRGLWLR